MEEGFQNLSAPSPTITVIMGDLNFPASEVTWQLVEGVLHPRVAGCRVRCDKDDEGGHVRQHAARLFSLTEVPPDPTSWFTH